jgi:nucleoside-diphosphate-sugar epimerase
MKKALVGGAGGFIGHHLVSRLKREGFWVRGVDLKFNEFAETRADDFMIGDLRDPQICRAAIDRHFDEVYQLAADMGGAGYVFGGENDAKIMHNSALVNLNVLDSCTRVSIGRIFYSSSACMYPEYNQLDPSDPNCAEDSAYPAAPDSEYGWEKLFSERLYLAYHRNHGMEVRIARFHNIFGPEGTWTGGREKSPAALCRKVAEAKDGDEIDECLDGVLRLTRSDWTGPVNIGSDEMVTINQMAGMIIEIEGKKLSLKHVPGPLGVRGRNSDNRLIRQQLGWTPTQPLIRGLEKTYRWIEKQVRKEGEREAP